MFEITPFSDCAPGSSDAGRRSENSARDSAWLRANQRYLMAAVAEVRELLERSGRRSQHGAAKPSPILPTADPWPADLPPPALDRLCQIFSLSPFERRLLTLCAGMELDSGFPDLCARAQGHAERSQPTFELALAALPGGHWSALGVSSPLRRWHLVAVGNGDALTSARLRIDERVLHYLAGVDQHDEGLEGIASPVSMNEEVVPSHGELAGRLAKIWSGADADERPILFLCGTEALDQQAVASALCARLKLGLWRIPADALPLERGALDHTLCLWRREAALRRGVLLLDCHGVEADDPGRNSAIRRVVESVSPLVVGAVERRDLGASSLLSFAVARPTTEEQRRLWHARLGRTGARNDLVERLVGQFRLNAPQIAAACTQGLSWSVPSSASAGEKPGGPQKPGGPRDLGKHLWDACRVQLRPRLDDLAQRIETAATWDDLVLPSGQQRMIEEICQEIRHRVKVHEGWGFAARSSRGQGTAVLFAGSSGTGKTLAAEVIAAELELDLYRIELASVVSKWVGETEKNLQKIFNAADNASVVLLFDEGDALFGKRTEVKDSHDRFANIEVSYLMQRIESYRGLAILTTNLKESVDQAFLRRFRFVVDFPFPNALQRQGIWQRIFPPETPTEGLSFQALAQLSISGGNIRNIALAASFLAASADRPVTMEDLWHAARREYDKLGKPWSEAEVQDWR